MKSQKENTHYCDKIETITENIIFEYPCLLLILIITTKIHNMIINWLYLYFFFQNLKSI